MNDAEKKRTPFGISTVNNTVNRLAVCLNGVAQILRIYTQRPPYSREHGCVALICVYIFVVVVVVVAWVCVRAMRARAHVCLCIFFTISLRENAVFGLIHT